MNEIMGKRESYENQKDLLGGSSSLALCEKGYTSKPESIPGNGKAAELNSRRKTLDNYRLPNVPDSFKNMLASAKVSPDNNNSEEGNTTTQLLGEGSFNYSHLNSDSGNDWSAYDAGNDAEDTLNNSGFTEPDASGKYDVSWGVPPGPRDGVPHKS